MSRAAILIPIIEYGDPVGIGLAGVVGGTFSGVIKRDEDGSTRRVLNEIIALRIAQTIGLPVPAGFLVQDKDPKGIAFASVTVGTNRSGKMPPPADLEALWKDETDLAAAILVLDYWLVNWDRHAKNICFHAKGEWPLAIFDHDQVLGGASVLEIAPLDPTSIFNSPQGFEKKLDSASKLTRGKAVKALQRWCDVVESLSPAVESLIMEDLHAVGLLSEKTSKQLASFLTERRRYVRRDLKTNHDTLEWGLGL